MVHHRFRQRIHRALRSLWHHDREKKKRKKTYEEKLREIARRYHFVEYRRQTYEIPVIDHLIQMLLNWMKVTEIGWLRWLLERELEEIRRFRRSIERNIHMVEMIRAISGRAFVPVRVEWVGHRLHIYIDKRIDAVLNSPELRDITLDALSVILEDVLSSRYHIEIPPETYERLKGILQYIYEKVYAPYKPMPCKRSQYIVEIRPITMQYFRGYGATYYVVRYVKNEALQSPYTVRITKPITFHFARFIRVKLPWELISTFINAGSTSAIHPDDTVIVSTDHLNNPRRFLKVYQAILLKRRVAESFARQVGARERIADFSHCSVYVTFKHIPTRFREYAFYKSFRRRFPSVRSI